MSSQKRTVVNLNKDAINLISIQSSLIGRHLWVDGCGGAADQWWYNIPITQIETLGTDHKTRSIDLVRYGHRIIIIIIIWPIINIVHCLLDMTFGVQMVINCGHSICSSAHNRMTTTITTLNTYRSV